MGALISCWRANICSRGQSRDSCITRLLAITASGALATMRSARREGLRQRVAGLGQVVDDAVALQELGRHGVAGHDDLGRDAVGHLVGQAQQAAGRGDEAALDFRQAEARSARGHDHVAGQRHLEPPPNA